MANGCLAINRDCGNPLHRFETIEVPLAVISYMGKKRLNCELAKAWTGVQQRANALIRKETVQHLAGKTTNNHIARFLGITAARVRQIIHELESNKS